MQVTQHQVAHSHRTLLPPGSIATRQQCLEAVERLGFLWPFTPGNGLLPALFPALACRTEGERWEWVWGWKDQLSASREAYYGKVVGGRPTLVSREWLPRFYALTGNTGDLEDDLLHLAEATRLDELAHKVCSYLQEHGPTGTRTLQAQLTDGSRPMRRALEKALTQLDAAMLIVKCGAEGGNSIANVWDLFPRFWPEAVEQGTGIPTREAALLLLRQLFQLTPAMPERAAVGLFPWNERHQRSAIARLLEAGELKRCRVDGKPALCRADWQPLI